MSAHVTQSVRDPVRAVRYSCVVPSKKHKSGLSEVRVIGGRWRGRKIRFDAKGIRPTGDRVRETLFNWLTPQLPAARCLDLFAGSGALGVEALSRGAAYVVFVERMPAVAAAVSDNLTSFGATAADFTVTCGDALAVPFETAGPFDVVFVDPPFDKADSGLDSRNLCTLLEDSGSLAARCFVYLEMDRSQAVPELPSGWQVLREKTAGQVRYALLERNKE